jgi:hypothetical protein
MSYGGELLMVGSRLRRSISIEPSRGYRGGTGLSHRGQEVQTVGQGTVALGVVGGDAGQTGRGDQLKLWLVRSGRLSVSESPR